MSPQLEGGDSSRKRAASGVICDADGGPSTSVAEVARAVHNPRYARATFASRRGTSMRSKKFSAPTVSMLEART